MQLGVQFQKMRLSLENSCKRVIRLTRTARNASPSGTGSTVSNRAARKPPTRSSWTVGCLEAVKKFASSRTSRCGTRHRSGRASATVPWLLQLWGVLLGSLYFRAAHVVCRRVSLKYRCRLYVRQTHKASAPALAAPRQRNLTHFSLSFSHAWGNSATGARCR